MKSGRLQAVKLLNEEAVKTSPTPSLPYKTVHAKVDEDKHEFKEMQKYLLNHHTLRTAPLGKEQKLPVTKDLLRAFVVYLQIFIACLLVYMY